MEIINIDKDSEIVLDTQAKELNININNCRVIISDISPSKKNIILNNGDLDYCYIKKDSEAKDTYIKINGGKAIIRVIDILDENTKDEYIIDLDGSNSEIEFNVASIAKNKRSKEYKIRSNSNIVSEIKIDCFGISQDTSSIKYDVTSFIKKGAKGARVNQNSKILLFDKGSIGVNNPVLEIEENDVKANHGSSIGMIDEETLFYLTSRGIEEKEARNLVSLGRITYIIDEVKNKDIKNDLLNEVLERV